MYKNLQRQWLAKLQLIDSMTGRDWQPESIPLFVRNTLAMKISATFCHRRDWSQELSHRSFHTIEQQRLTDSDWLWWSWTRVL